MNTGTKIFLAVFALFVGVLVLYYGALTPSDAANPAAELAMVDPAVKPSTETPLSPKAVPAKPLFSKPVQEAPAIDSPKPVSTADLVKRVDGPSETAPVATAEVEMGSAALPASLDPTQMLPLANVGTTILPDASSEGALSEPKPVTSDAPATLPQSNESTPPKGQPIRTVVERPIGTVKPNVGASITPNDLTPSKKPTPPLTTEYVVKSGDTMMTIAKSWFGDETKWSLIAKANPWVDPARMQIGQKLQLPAKDAKPAPVREQLATDKSVYIVRSGDSLAKIARDFYGNVAMWEKIYDANRTTIGDDPADLQVGMKLKIPTAAAPSTVTKSR